MYLRVLARPPECAMLKRFLSDVVRVRFAPSPTGSLHLGSLRTALFNYLFARSQKGYFLLRIEDTDRQRVVPDSSRKLQEDLAYFGLKWDEGPSCGGPFEPYVQSERKHIYKEAAMQLIDSGHAYFCFCSADRLDMLRRDAARRGTINSYDNRCRHLTKENAESRVKAGESHVIRFKLDRKSIHFKDLVFGDISYSSEEGDFVLMKSDGFPTYHMANVVDDYKMNISHVVRGMEWLASTSKHIQLYQAFQWNMPQWVHLPLITRNGSKKLSKRDNDAFIRYYIDEKGYLPLAVLNFLIRNGSGMINFDPGHLYTLEEMAENFSIEAIGRRNFMMDQKNLDMYGRLAFVNADFDNALLPNIRKHVKKLLPESSVMLAENTEYVKKVVTFLKENEENFSHLSELCFGPFQFFFTIPSSPKILLDCFEKDFARDLLQQLLRSSDWSLDAIKNIAVANKIPYPKLLYALRSSLIDCKSGPPILELFEFFGRDECIARLRRMIDMLS